MKYLVISTMKNEAPYVMEWLAYHMATGFTDFLIYTNDCTDGTDHLLDRLQDLGYVTHRRNKVLRRGPHKSALKYAFQEEVYHSADWVLISDADEFLNVKSGAGKVSDLVTTYPDTDAIPVTWRLFSSDNKIELPTELCIESFLDAESEHAVPGDKGRFVKTLFKPDERIEKLGLHAPVYNDKDANSVIWRLNTSDIDENGSPCRPSKDFGYKIVQMNHYAVRSVDAFLLKRDRGRANHVGETLGTEYWDRWNKGGQRDISILDRLTETKSNLEKMLEDPLLAYFNRAGQALNEQRLKVLVREPAFAELRANLVGRKVNNSDLFDSELGIGAPVRIDTGNADVISAMAANEALRVKAPNRHKNRQKMLATLPKGGRCAEIGVWNGGFSIEILNITRPRELVLVDPWDLLSQQSEDEWTHGRHKDSHFMADMFANVESQYGSMENVTICKGFSAKVLSSFPDNYFDWVYIDGNHLYDFVKEDVEISFRKVKSGGIIAGDDYYWKKDGRTHVKGAVNDAMTACGIDKDRSFRRMGQQFLIKVKK